MKPRRSSPFRSSPIPAFQFTLNGVKDGFMINYGSGAVGTEVVANRLGVGPTWDCPECKFEEFFLTAWAVSDPAILVDIPANTRDNQGQPHNRAEGDEGSLSGRSVQRVPHLYQRSDENTEPAHRQGISHLPPPCPAVAVFSRRRRRHLSGCTGNRPRIHLYL